MAANRASSRATTAAKGSVSGELEKPVTTGSGSQLPVYASLRCAADRNRSRPSRLTTVVNQARRSVITESCLSQRSQASWTMSSASATVPVSR